jgi:hypothetical protein
MITYTWPRPEEAAERAAWHVNNSRGEEFTPAGERYYVSDNARKEAVVPYAGAAGVELVVSSHFTPTARRYLAKIGIASCKLPDDPLSIVHVTKPLYDQLQPTCDIFNEDTQDIFPEDHPVMQATNWGWEQQECALGGAKEALAAHQRLQSITMQARGKEAVPSLRRQQLYYGLGWVQSHRLPDDDSSKRSFEYAARGFPSPPRTESNMRLVVPYKRKGKPPEEIGIHDHPQPHLWPLQYAYCAQHFTNNLPVRQGPVA